MFPLTILVLGFLAIAMSTATYRIHGEQLRNFVVADALMDIQILTTSAHLWLEELLSGDLEVKPEEVWNNLDQAMELAAALLLGGKSEHGLLVEPLDEPELRRRIDTIDKLLDNFKQGAATKIRQDTEGFLDLSRDEQFDAIFRQIQQETSELETITEHRQHQIRRRSQQLFFGILISWTLFIFLATRGLWKLTTHQLHMEESLQQANDELQTKTVELERHRGHLLALVDERTHELTTRYSQLQEEVTQRKEMHMRLSESKQRLQKLLSEFETLAQAISDPIVLLAPDCQILWSNNIPGPCSGAGLSGNQGQSCQPLALDRTPSCEGCSAISSFASGLEETSQTVSPDGRIWEVRAYPVKNEEKVLTSVLTISTDITDKVNRQAETMRAAHLASLGELAAGVAHEINNPINGVINYAQMLIDERKKAHEEYDIQNRILKEGRRIATIVKSLLSFARAEKGEVREHLDLHRVLAETLDLSAAQLGKDGIHLEIEVPGDLPLVYGHFQQLQQVLLNLINNARYALNQKYPGGDRNKRLTITAEKVSTDGKTGVRLTFIDQGTGIPCAIMPKVFNPFFSTKPKGAGTGLGLSISHGIITSHGGEITIDSSDGDYTKIMILLPAGANHE